MGDPGQPSPASGQPPRLLDGASPVAVAEPPGGPGAAPAGTPDLAAPARRWPGWRRPDRPVLMGAGIGLLLLAVLLLGFAGYLYGLSPVQNARAQATLYQQLRQELANQVAPLGPTTPGSPVAVLDIPAIGIRSMVVVQGTSPQNLTLGPGHLPDTPLPGQAGVAEIFGRRATFGAPFAALPRLRPGDIIRVITGQGTSTYRVAALGGSSLMVKDPAPNRLILLTASSPVIPAYYTYVDARLVSAAHPGLVPARTMSPADVALGLDWDTLIQTMFWALALAWVSAIGTVAFASWSRPAAYLAVAPVALAVLWNLYQSLAGLLPNVY